MFRQTIQDIMAMENRANAMEILKKPGQDFCDQFNYKLGDKFKLHQRPDKVTRLGGSIIRTITPVYHIWYEEIAKPHRHYWINFNGNTVIIKENIRVQHKDGFIYPDENNYQNKYYFHGGNSACEFLLRA